MLVLLRIGYYIAGKCAPNHLNATEQIRHYYLFINDEIVWLFAMASQSFDGVNYVYTRQNVWRNWWGRELHQ